VHYNGALVRDGVCGGNNGVLYHKWMECCADHDDGIDQSMRGMEDGFKSKEW
jgi:hypothetical protein